jgi:hypothetical protein
VLLGLNRTEFIKVACKSYLLRHAYIEKERLSRSDDR